MENNNKNNSNSSNNSFIIILFIGVLVLVLLMPTIYNFIEKKKLPKVQHIDIEIKEEKKEVTQDILESIHFPIMRNSIYNPNTYYSLDKFTVSNMSNADILYNAFLEVYEGNMTASNYRGKCTTNYKQFNRDYMDLRIKNVLGKNVDYTLETFEVPEDSNSTYKGTWIYDGSTSNFVYDGLCSSKATSIKYYNLDEMIKADYDDRDIVIYYYVGFAKVDGSNYIIYRDAAMTKEINKGTFTDLENLNAVFKSINKKDKSVYKYTFKDNLCSYNEYCLYEGAWTNEL